MSVGLPGRDRKDPKTRARQNKPEELTKLPRQSEAAQFDVPEMPPRDEVDGPWAASVVGWWRMVWTSPMRVMWADADVVSTLHDVVRLRQMAAETKKPKDLLGILKTVRHYEALLGLSPLDRRRLQWEIPSEPTVTLEAAVVQPTTGRFDDPRMALRARTAKSLEEGEATMRNGTDG